MPTLPSVSFLQYQLAQFPLWTFLALHCWVWEFHSGAIFRRHNTHELHYPEEQDNFGLSCSSLWSFCPLSVPILPHILQRGSGHFGGRHTGVCVAKGWCKVSVSAALAGQHCQLSPCSRGLCVASGALCRTSPLLLALGWFCALN